MKTKWMCMDDSESVFEAIYFFISKDESGFYFI